MNDIGIGGSKRSLPEKVLTVAARLAVLVAPQADIRWPWAEVQATRRTWQLVVVDLFNVGIVADALRVAGSSRRVYQFARDFGHSAMMQATKPISVRRRRGVKVAGARLM